MIDLNFYNQLFTCINYSSKYTFLGVASTILSTRGTLKQRPDILNDFENKKAKFEKYKLNGLLDYVNDYIAYFN